MDIGVNNFFNTFHIGTYFLQQNARTEKRIKDMRDCGIDLVFGMDNDAQTLDLFYKHGVHAVVSGVIPGWFGGNGDNAGTMQKIRKKEDYRKAAQTFTDHPAIVGIDAGDEPSSADFPYYGQIIELLKILLPSKFPYLNIYPSYGMLATNDKAQIQKELGVSSYPAYIASYGENIDLPYLSFDHYVYSSDKDRLFSDLATAAAYCRTSNRKLWVVLQVNSANKDVFLSEEQLCFQAFSAMAYGSSAVSWACYSAGWWHNQVLDADGNPTEQYEKLKSVNHKMKAIAAEYIQYKWLDTETVGNGDTTEFGSFRCIRSSKNALLGKFAKENGKKALFLSPIQDQNSPTLTLSFTLESGKQAWIHRPSGTEILSPEKSGTYTLSLHGAEACFITVT